MSVILARKACILSAMSTRRSCGVSFWILNWLLAFLVKTSPTLIMKSALSVFWWVFFHFFQFLKRTDAMPACLYDHLFYTELVVSELGSILLWFGFQRKLTRCNVAVLSKFKSVEVLLERRLYRCDLTSQSPRNLFYSVCYHRSILLYKRMGSNVAWSLFPLSAECYLQMKSPRAVRATQ